VRTLVGRSLTIRRAIRLIEEAAATNAPVIITGESGTGKELAARAIHDKSPRRDRPYIAINCAAVPESLIESELFGHERGAFTGADRRREGCFERANGGSLLLDEITEMRPEMQAKLLRVLEEHKILRLGASRELSIDVRVFAASNRSLGQAIHDGRLRADLYYRLNVYTIHLPPLRDRLEDLPLLVEHFIRTFNCEYGKSVGGMSQDCLDTLRIHRWPGNVRELRNVIQRAVIRCQSRTLSAEDLPLEPIPLHRQAEAQFVVQLGSSVYEVERELIVWTLAFAGGNKTRASNILGMSRRNLYNRLERYDEREINGDANRYPNTNRRNGTS
jgi:two-component system, NtrC family, response regulator HydG